MLNNKEISDLVYNCGLENEESCDLEEPILDGFDNLWNNAATCKRYRHSDGSAALVWINKDTGKHAPFACRSWRCDQCRPKIAKFLKYRVGNWAEKKKLTRFWTFTLARGEGGYLTAKQLQMFTQLTVDEEKEVEKAYKDMLIMGRMDTEFAFEIADEIALNLRTARAASILKQARRRINRRQLFHPSVMLYRKMVNRYLSSIWNKWRTATMRKFGNFSYIRMTEYHSDSIHPHIHCLVSSWLPIEYVRRTWDSYGGGEQVDVEYVEDIRRVSAYVAKYISKSAETPAAYWPKNTRHITTSRDIKIKLTPLQYETISNTEEQEGVRCPYAYSTVQLASENFEKCHRCVFRKHCGIVLPQLWGLYQGRKPLLPMQPSEVIDTEYHRQSINRINRGKKPDSLEMWSV
jgi:hypothetical protein